MPQISRQLPFSNYSHSSLRVLTAAVRNSLVPVSNTLVPIDSPTGVLLSAELLAFPLNTVISFLPFDLNRSRSIRPPTKHASYVPGFDRFRSSTLRVPFLVKCYSRYTKRVVLWCRLPHIRIGFYHGSAACLCSILASARATAAAALGLPIVCWRWQRRGCPCFRLMLRGAATVVELM